nr:uncharacterized protein LOC101436203 isoform X2 [Dasypus novemcinctus]
MAEEVIDPSLVQTSFRTSKNMEQHLLSGHLGREDLDSSNILGNRKVVLPTKQTLMKTVPRDERVLQGTQGQGRLMDLRKMVDYASGDISQPQNVLTTKDQLDPIHGNIRSFALQGRSHLAQYRSQFHQPRESTSEGSTLHLARDLRAFDSDYFYGLEEDIFWKQVVLTTPCTEEPEEKLVPFHLGKEIPFSSGLEMQDQTVRPT